MRRTAPFLAVGPFLRALFADEEALDVVCRADRIELQWFDSVALAARLRRRLPHSTLVGVFHDVVSQGYARTLSTRRAGLRARSAALVRLLLAILVERRAMRALDTAVVLSDKDRALLARRRGSSRVLVVSPPLDDDDMPSRPRTEPLPAPEVLFVGALWRMENDDAARWLLRDIWPRIRRAVPAAHLTIAGHGPSDVLRQEAGRRDDVEVTGYVDSLGPYYRRASVAIAPLRRGAGVKLKSVVAMMWGIPVVATSVGAEGVAGPDVFVAVHDDPARFADAVTEALRFSQRTRDVAARAFAWSHDVYSAAAYARSLERLYP
ncbi:glycosyltransferase [Geodermatophilus sp. CPCC 205761]|uniref:glycosyltransferase n=1 Tax=Geodermatophilus sp. CPCC 205761 TaxID=2936597 RepID=UPI003EEF8968